MKKLALLPIILLIIIRPIFCLNIIAYPLQFQWGEDLNLYVQVEGNITNVSVYGRITNITGSIILDYTPMIYGGNGLFTLYLNYSDLKLEPATYYLVYKVVENNTTYYRVVPMVIERGDLMQNLNSISVIIQTHEDMLMFIVLWVLIALSFTLYSTDRNVIWMILGLILLMTIVIYHAMIGRTTFDKGLITTEFIIGGIMVILAYKYGIS